jgi:ribose transport system substrate-binding protein
MPLDGEEDGLVSIDRGRARWNSRLFAATALAAALVVGACGGGDDNGNAEPAAPSAEAGIVAESRQMIDDARAPIEFEPPGSEIDASKLKGRTVAIISVDQRVPILAIANDAMREAAREAGIKTTLFDARSEVTRMQQGIDRAGREADAIILTGIPIAAVGGALEKVRDKPTVAVLNNQPDADAPGQGAGEMVDASSAPNYENNGALVAARAVVDTDGKANVVIFNTEEITPSPDVLRGMRRILDRCEGCKVDQNTTPLAEWSTALTPRAQTELRRNPEANYLLPIFDAMGIFVTAGVRQAGAAGRVKVASMNGTPAALQLVQEGDIFTANPGAPVGWIGWHAMDQAMRGMLDQEYANPEVPSRLLDADNLKGVDVEDIDAPYDNPKYREGFRELWGLGQPG